MSVPMMVGRDSAAERRPTIKPQPAFLSFPHPVTITLCHPILSSARTG